MFKKSFKDDKRLKDIKESKSEGKEFNLIGYNFSTFKLIII